MFACSPHDQHDWATSLKVIALLNYRENIISASLNFNLSLKWLTVIGFTSATSGLSLEQLSLPWPLISTQRLRIHKFNIFPKLLQPVSSDIFAEEVDRRDSRCGGGTLPLRLYPLGTSCTTGYYVYNLSIGTNLGTESKMRMCWFWLKPDNACIVRLKFWLGKSCTCWQRMHLPTISQNKACFLSYRVNIYLLRCGGKKHGVLNILTIDVIQPISLLKPNLTCFFQKYDFTGSKG